MPPKYLSALKTQLSDAVKAAPPALIRIGLVATGLEIPAVISSLSDKEGDPATATATVDLNFPATAGVQRNTPTERLDYRLRTLDVLVKFNRTFGNYVKAFQLSDTMNVVKDSLRRVLDDQIVNRAVEKSEAERYQTELNLLTSQKNLNRLQFYILLITLVGVLVIGTLLFSRFRLRKKRLFELAEMEKQLLALGKKLAEEQLQYAENLMAVYINTLREKAQLIDNLTMKLQLLKENDQQANILPMTAQIEQLVSATILTDEDWRQFRILFDQTYPGFTFQLREKFPDLSPAETRLLILPKLKLSNQEMAQMLGISVDAIRKARYRIRK